MLSLLSKHHPRPKAPFDARLPKETWRRIARYLTRKGAKNLAWAVRHPSPHLPNEYGFGVRPFLRHTSRLTRAKFPCWQLSRRRYRALPHSLRNLTLYIPLQQEHFSEFVMRLRQIYFDHDSQYLKGILKQIYTELDGPVVFDSPESTQERKIHIELLCTGKKTIVIRRPQWMEVLNLGAQILQDAGNELVCKYGLEAAFPQNPDDSIDLSEVGPCIVHIPPTELEMVAARLLWTKRKDILDMTYDFGSVIEWEETCNCNQPLPAFL